MDTFRNTMKTKYRILITGASGFIGRHALLYYVKKNWDVVALVRKKGVYEHEKFKEVEFVVGDVTKKSTLDKATKDVDFVVHFAGLKSDENESYKVNVVGTRNLIQSAKKNKVKKVINISTLSAKLSKKGVYGQTKLQADKEFINSRVIYTILRPSIVYAKEREGVFGSISRYVNYPFIPVFGDGKTVFYPIYVEDLVKSTEISLLSKRTDRKIYDVGGPNKVSFDELILNVSKFMGKKVRILHIPISVGILAGKIFSKLTNRPPITVSNVLGSTQDVEVDLTRFFSDFKFTPRSLTEGFFKVFEDYDMRILEANFFIHYVLPKKIDENRKLKLIKLYHLGMTKYNLKYMSKFPNRLLLGPIDAFTKIFFPDSLIQKKIKMSMAIVEASPVSADWLLPRNTSTVKIFFEVLALFVTSGIKLLFGVVLFFTPGFYKKYGI